MRVRFGKLSQTTNLPLFATFRHISVNVDKTISEFLLFYFPRRLNIDSTVNILVIEPQQYKNW